MVEQSKLKWVLPIVLISYFLILMSNSVIFTGVVKIARDLRLDALNLSWISTSYTLTFGGFLLIGGKLGDIFGRRLVLNIGLAMFVISSFVIGIVDNAGLIFGARAVQGLGSALLAPSTLALIMDNFEGSERVKAISYYGATAGIGSAVGLLLGGFFADALSWRYGFFINIPVGIALIVMSQIVLPKDGGERKSIEYIGAVISVPAMALLVYGIVGRVYQTESLIAAILLLAVFIAYEHRIAEPMLPLRIFADRERMAGYIGRFLFLGAMMGFWFFMPQLMQNQMGMTALQSAMGFIPLTVVNFYSAMKVPAWTKSFGNRNVLLAGLVIIFIGLGWFMFYRTSDTYWTGVLMPMILLGFGQGLVLSPLTVMGVAHVDSEDAGIASGVVNMMHQLGGSIGLAVIAILGTTQATAVANFQFAMLYGAGGMIAIAFVTVIVLTGNSLPKLHRMAGK